MTTPMGEILDAIHQLLQQGEAAWNAAPTYTAAEAAEERILLQGLGTLPLTATITNAAGITRFELAGTATSSVLGLRCAIDKWVRKFTTEHMQ